MPEWLTALLGAIGGGGGALIIAYFKMKTDVAKMDRDYVAEREKMLAEQQQKVWDLDNRTIARLEKRLAKVDEEKDIIETLLAEKSEALIRMTLRAEVAERELVRKAADG